MVNIIKPSSSALRIVATVNNCNCNNFYRVLTSNLILRNIRKVGVLAYGTSILLCYYSIALCYCSLSQKKQRKVKKNKENFCSKYRKK